MRRALLKLQHNQRGAPYAINIIGGRPRLKIVRPLFCYKTMKKLGFVEIVYIKRAQPAEKPLYLAVPRIQIPAFPASKTHN